MKEYKVLIQKEKWYSTKILDPLSLEQSLNDFAQQGWTVKSLTAIGYQKQDLVVVLEREVGTWG